MRFYNRQHRHYCGIDLHVRTMYICILLNPAASERAVITLERAFTSDPMFTWIFPDPHRRSTSLRLMNRVPVQYGVRYGHVTESNDGMAVALRVLQQIWQDFAAYREF